MAVEVHTLAPYLRSYSYAEGLPASTLYDIHAHPSGHLFLGTEVGLVKFNGKNFTLISAPQGPGRSVSYLAHGPDSSMWCMNFYGALFTVKGDSLVEIEVIRPLMKGRIPLSAPVITETDVWILHYQGLIRYNRSSGRVVEELVLNDSISSHFFKGLCRQEAELLVADNKLNLYHIHTRTYQRSIQSSGTFQADRLVNKTGSICLLRQATNGLALLDLKKGSQVSSFNIPSSGTLLHAEVVRDQLWFCTSMGLLALDQRLNLSQLLVGLRVTDVAQDFQGNLWVSTLDKGLFMIPLLGLSNLTELSQAPQNTVRLLFQKGRLWAGTGNGALYEQLSMASRFTRLPVNQPVEVEFISYDEQTDRVFFNGGYLQTNPDRIVLTQNLGKGIAPIGKGLYAVARFNGVFLVDEGFFATKPGDTQAPQTYQRLLRQGRCYAILFDRSTQKLWASQADGLFWFDSLLVPHPALLPNGSPCYAASLCHDSKGNVYAAAQQQGVWLLRENGQVSQLNADRYFQGAWPRKVHFEQGTLWVITNKGLSSFEPESQRSRHFHEEFNLSTLYLYDVAVSDSILYMATQEGLLALNRLEQLSPTSPKLSLSKVFLGSQQLPNGSHTLYPPVQNLHITFDLVQFNRLRKGLLQYQLQGKDNQWRSLPEEVYDVYIASLEPGTYQLKAQYVEGGKVLHRINTGFVLQVLTPWWQSIWFKLLVLVLLLALMAVPLYYWQYRRALKREKQLKEQLLKLELNNSRLTALRARMNPHFIYNVFNSIQGMIYQNLKSEAGEYLVKFSHLIRRYLQLSDKQYISLSEELEALRLYLDLEAMNFDRQFQYSIRVDPQIDQSGAYLPTMIVQPLVENAIKHGLMHKRGDKLLTIVIKSTEEGITIEVEDNGIGRVAAQAMKARQEVRHASFATSAIAQRIELINQSGVFLLKLEIKDLYTETGQAAGTLVRLFLQQNISKAIV